jgi:hypothetical protein
MLINSPEDGLIRPKHAVQRDYICNKGVLTVIFHTDIYIYIYFFFFLLLLNTHEDAVLKIRKGEKLEALSNFNLQQITCMLPAG